MKKKLLEIYGLTEATPMKHAETELNMGTSVARSPKKYTPSTGKAQSDIDSATSVVKKEGAGEVQFSPEELRQIRNWAGEYREYPLAESIISKINVAIGED